MTAHCRPLLLLCASLALLLPACLVIGGPSGPPVVEPQDKVSGDKTGSPREVFAGLRPGEKIPNPGEKIPNKGVKEKDATAAKDSKDSKDKKDSKDSTTAQRPTGDAKTGPIAPPLTSGVKTAGDPPGPYPLPKLQPLHANEPPLLALVRAHVENRPAQAMEILQTFDPANQEFLLAILPALVRGAAIDFASDPTSLAVLADQFRAAAHRLEPRAPLLVENMALCREVFAYGRYNPRPQGEAYRPNDMAQLYLEVRNLPSQPVQGPRGETHLTQVLATAEVKDAHGVRVEQPDPDDWRRRVRLVRFERKLFSRGPVHDFHVVHNFQVPATPGVYTVTLELRDPITRRTVRTDPVRFDVSGP